MSTLSVCLIVKNEEKVIKRCLDIVKQIADEIIVVDTGSSDNTKEIAKKYTDKVYEFKWCDDFSFARNYSFSLASCDYIMWIDADDIIPNKSIQIINNLKEKMNADTYMLRYDLSVVNRKSQFSFWRERIVRNNNNAKWNGAVHECITPFGKIEYINANIIHSKIEHRNPKRNLMIYYKTRKIRELSPREQYYFSRELYDNGYYRASIKNFKKFINSKKGWIVNVIDAYYIIGLSYIALKEYNKALKYLLQALEFTAPRPDISCAIGDCYLMSKNYNLSKDWYLLALNYQQVSNKHTFVQNTHYGYYPAIQLCLCYYNLGDLSKAIYYNEKAGRYDKHSIAVKNNRDFFNSLIKNT